MVAVSITRKEFLIGAGTVTTAAVMKPFIARAARPIVIKVGIDVPLEDPTTQYLIVAADGIKKGTGGEVDVRVFPNSELGNDTNTLSNVRSGAVQMMGLGDNILATLVPSVAIDNMGFAFKDAKTAFAAVDGAVGDIVRADIMRHGLQPMPRIWDDGFREITTSTKPIETPEDLQGFKIRVPDSPSSLSLFKGLGAAAVTMNLAELYTALQTHVVDGQENPLSFIETLKFYQAQKYCSLTNHMWNGRWMLMNGTFWRKLSADHQKVIADGFDAAAAKQRTANEALNNSLREKLTSQGLRFNAPDTAPFRDTLVKSGFYSYWRKKFGPTLWSALEKYTGTLA